MNGSTAAPLELLVGEGLSAGELARLRRADALLRALPGPPPVLPRGLTIAVEELARVQPRESHAWSADSRRAHTRPARPQ